MSIVTKKRTIYLDNAASTPVDPIVAREMVRTMAIYGNPSSFNNAGRKAKKELEIARLNVARFIGAKPEEIIFTSSGSEANNMAIMCTVTSAPKERNEILTTPIEHPSILGPLANLKGDGKSILLIKLDNNGTASLEDLKSKLSEKTYLVTVMYANNEIGTIEPIKKITKILADYKRGSLYPLFHVDACQATGYLDMNVNNLGVDMMTFNGAKIYGPRGVGVLYVKNGTPMSPFVSGGGQERGYRAGTENLPAIAGLAKALTLIDTKDSVRLRGLRDYFLASIKKIMPDIKINGPEGENRLSNNINISIPGLDSENLLLELDKYEIYVSSGSACTARSVEPSHVLKAIGLGSKYLTGALRFSLGKQNNRREIDQVLKILPMVVRNLKKRYRM